MTRFGQEELSRLIRKIYELASPGSDSGELLRQISGAFDSESHLLQVREAGDPPSISVINATQNFMAIMPAYGSHYYKSDPWAQRGLDFLNQPVLGTELVAQPELLRTEFYNDLARPSGVHHMIGGVFDVGPKAVGIVGFHRAACAAEFTMGDRALMGLLMPHLGQALRLKRHFERQEHERQLGMDTLSALSVAVIVVQYNAQVVRINDAAERLLDAGVLRLIQGRLETTDLKLRVRLANAIRAAALSSVGRSTFAVETLFAARSEQERFPIIVSPLPVGAGEGVPLAAIFVGDIDALDEPAPDLLQKLYGLTPTEARLALALLNGQRLAEYAETAGVSMNTARSQLKSVFERTGSHRQSDLLQQLMRNPILRLAGWRR